MKKLLIIFFLLAAVGTGAAYYLSLGQSPKAPAKSNSSQKSLREIYAEPAITPASSHDGDAVWFGLNDGRMMWLNLDTGQISEYPLPQTMGKSFRKLFWPSQGSDFIAMGMVGDQVTYNYYNYSEKKYYTLPSNVVNLDWLPDGKRIAIVWKGGDGKISLVTSNPDASGYRVVTALPWQDMVPKPSPSSNSVLMYRSSVPTDVNKMYLFDLDTGSYTEVIKEGRNTGALWSPKGGSFAFTRLEEGKSKAYVYYQVGEDIIDLGLETTIEKMAFSDDGFYLYAAVKDNSDREMIVQLDILKKEQKTLFTLENGLTAKNLVIIGQKIYFTSGSDGKLYGIE